jgi:hypothetical protein
MTAETDGALPDIAARLLDRAELAYASDYLSFAGADEHGRVAFAIDTNRGRDGEAFQAEHLYAVLHDEHAGWVDVAGTGRYPNPRAALLTLPDSPAFAFTGGPWTGLTVRSERNALVLDAEPMVERLRRTDETTLYAMTTAAATLHRRDVARPGARLLPLADRLAGDVRRRPRARRARPAHAAPPAGEHLGRRGARHVRRDRCAARG